MVDSDEDNVGLVLCRFRFEEVGRDLLMFVDVSGFWRFLNCSFRCSFKCCCFRSMFGLCFRSERDLDRFLVSDRVSDRVSDFDVGSD